MFKTHHYLDAKINKASRCYIAVWDDVVVGFCATLSMPSGTIKNAWRSSRLCILPEFQGLGIGPRFSDTIAQLHLDQGYKFYSRTSHPKLGLYREKSPLWRATIKNCKIRYDIKYGKIYKNHIYDNKRLCFSYEYVGELKN